MIAAVVACVAISGFAQDLSSPMRGTIIPPQQAPTPTPRIHLPLYIFIPDHNVNPDIPNGETPASIACIYGVTTHTSGCPKSGTIVPTGGTKAIAVVEYGRYSAVQSDLVTFSNQFSLGGNTTLIEQCYGAPTCPDNSGTQWDLETALDVQWAHAMAPNAQIIVAEFANDPIGDGAVSGAAQYIAAHYTSGEESNSWGYLDGENWCGSGNCELSYDSNFVQSGIVFFASAGDSGVGAQYPSISPNVVSAGGTQITRDSGGNFTGENCWNGSGGGISQYEVLPQYQIWIANRTGPKRGTPDWAGVASPASGVDVYSTTFCHGWCIVGGTSAASPILAGITNQSGHFSMSTLAELSKTYQYYLNPVGYHQKFFDVTTGSNGQPAQFGWDQCTGLGSIRQPSFF